MTRKVTWSMIGEATRTVTRNMTRGANKDVLPPEDTSSFMVNSIERCSMTESSPEGGGVGWGKADLAKGSLLVETRSLS